MQWQPCGDGWSAEIDKDSTAEILSRSKKGFTIWRIVLRGRSGSISSAQARVEALVGLVQGASENEAALDTGAFEGAAPLRT